MSTTVKQLLEEANAAVPRITPAEAREMMAKPNTLIVDVRDAPEVEQSGKVAGAINVSRGMLEFRGKTLKDLGYERVYNLGGFKDWAEGGGAVDKPVKPG